MWFALTMQDGKINYDEFVAMMKRGTVDGEGNH